MSDRLLERREVAQEYVANLRARTACERCGAQPVEWHNEEHVDKHGNRIAQLAVHGSSIERIQAEIDASEALCRSCHMAADGRAADLVTARPRKKGDVIVPPVPCSTCGNLTKPSWRGKCRRCYDRERRSG